MVEYEKVKNFNSLDILDFERSKSQLYSYSFHHSIHLSIWAF